MLVGEPTQQISALDDIDRGDARRRLRGEPGRDLECLRAHGRPVLHGHSHISKNSMDVLGHLRIRRGDEIGLQFDAHPRLGESAGGCGIIDIEIKHLEEGTAVITSHGKLRVHDTMNGPSLAHELIRHGVDEERHVISDHADHRAGVTGLWQDADDGLAGRPHSR